MKKTILSLIIIQLAVFPSVAFATCTHAVGDVVKILSPAVVAKQISGYAVVKDEFETTEEFNARKKAANKKRPNGTLMVKATYDSEHAIYDANSEKFLIKRYAWHNIPGYFSDSVPSISRYDSGFRAIGLQINEKVTGSYKGSNAYGKEVAVITSVRTVYGIFDSKQKWGSPYISLAVPRAQAKALKSNMRFGIEFTPKEPFLFQGERYYDPTSDDPREIVVKVNSIVGDIECVVVTDAKGTVLKVVDIAP